MNRGDTAYLMLNYTLNGDPLVQDAYQEIELQIRSQENVSNVKKLMTQGEIEWGTLTYEDDHGVEQSFTGYYAHLDQEDTFALGDGMNDVQLRVMVSDEVGSSAIASMTLGAVLSRKVLTDDTD